MNTLPNEIILILFENIKLITDKRQFLRTCLLYNNITKQPMKHFENNFRIHYTGLILEKTYCMEKFTLELCHDKYFGLIPMSYITPNNKILVSALATFNCKPLLELAKYNKYDLSEVCYYAIVNDNLNIFNWGRKNGSFCRETAYAFSYAAGNGYIEVLEWGHSYCRFKNDLSSVAAFCGHLNVLKWLVEKGYPLNKNICFYASKKGHLDILIWARENGCEWDINTFFNVQDCGNIECLKWVTDNGCPTF